MTDTPDAFTAKIDQWVADTKERQVAVFRQATQTLVSTAQSLIPVDTGFARASVQASLEEMPLINPALAAPHIAGRKPDSGPVIPYYGSQVVLTIANATMDDTIHIGWTANYVEYLEYGHSNQAPSGFVRLSAEQWPQIVSDTIDELKARAA